MECKHPIHNAYISNMEEDLGFDFGPHDCSKRKWAQPAKPYGFWNTDKSNAKYLTNKDPAIQRLPGRKQAVDY